MQQSLYSVYITPQTESEKRIITIMIMDGSLCVSVCVHTCMHMLVWSTGHVTSLPLACLVLQSPLGSVRGYLPV